MGKQSWRLYLGMQEENLSAVNIEAASSWIITLLLFLQLLVNFPEFAAKHKLEETSEILKYYFQLHEKQLKSKKSCQYYFQDACYYPFKSTFKHSPPSSVTQSPMLKHP